jgi:hypothetical protein
MGPCKLFLKCLKSLPAGQRRDRAIRIVGDGLPLRLTLSLRRCLSARFESRSTTTALVHRSHRTTRFLISYNPRQQLLVHRRRFLDFPSTRSSCQLPSSPILQTGHGWVLTAECSCYSCSCKLIQQQIRGRATTDLLTLLPPDRSSKSTVERAWASSSAPSHLTLSREYLQGNPSLSHK